MRCVKSGDYMPDLSTALYCPQKVYIDKAVKKLAYTEEILGRLGEVTTEIIADPATLKAEVRTLRPDQTLLLTRFKGELLHEFKAMTLGTGRPTYSLNLISNCHLSCSYCVLQSYLHERPFVTLYTNIDEVMEQLADHLERIPRGAVVVSGQVADSLALEDLTGLHQRLIPFFGSQDRVTLELKTKCATVKPLLKLKHGKQTVVSWSVAPERVQAEEEVQTATIPERIEAMKTVQKAGYSLGIHFDPVVHHTGWEKNYKKLVDQIFSAVDESRIRWVSIGTLRFPVRQVALMRERFPKNRKIYNNLVSTQRRFMHYPDRLRDAIYTRMREYLNPHIASDKIYISMETEQSELQHTA